MPRVYTVEAENVTVANASGDYDILELDAATDKPIELVELVISQNTELADAAEEQLRLRIIRGHATTGNGTTTTPRPVSSVDTAAGFTAKTFGSTIASAGTAINNWSENWNLRQPYVWGPRPANMGIWTSGADLLVVRLMAAVLDDVNMSVTATVVEYP